MVEEKKKSKILSIIKYLMETTFYGLSLFSLNKKLKYINSFYHNNVFLRQVLINKIVGAIQLLPLLIGIFLAYLIFSKQGEFKDHMVLIYSQLTSLKFDVFKSIGQLSNFSGPLIAMVKVVSYGFLTTFIFGLILKRHPIIKNTQKFKEILEANSLIRENDHRVILATNIGFLMDITGSTPEELERNSRIWQALNLKVKDFVEDPKDRKMVFFKKAYELKDTYIYDFKELK